MSFRDAILQAAKHIEEDPQDFQFMTWKIPNSCGSPGCALGWVGYFAGVDIGNASTVAKAMGYEDPYEVDRADMSFYRDVEALLPKTGKESYLNWQTDPKVCAKGLRLYADKYYPVEETA